MLPGVSVRHIIFCKACWHPLVLLNTIFILQEKTYKKKEQNDYAVNVDFQTKI